MKACRISAVLLGVVLTAGRIAGAGEPNLEIGLQLGAATGSGGLLESTVPTLGFSGNFGWYFERWMVGIATRGTFAMKSATLLVTDGETLRGRVGTRRIFYGPLARYYPHRSRYLQFGLNVASAELLRAKRHLRPTLPDHDNRYFVRGHAYSVGYGTEWPERGTFVRLEYDFERYRTANFVNTVLDIGTESASSDLRTSARVHALSVTYGFTRLF